MYSVYVHVNKINKKSYIGLTKNDMMFRWKQHIKDTKSKDKSNRYFANAIVKYGSKNWLHQILEYIDTYQEACQIEKKWIKHFKSNDKNFGYNSTNGGEYCVCSKETKQKMKLSAQKRVADPNWVSPLKLISKERRAELYARRKGKVIKSKHTKEIILETAKACQSQNEIGEKLGCTGANIGILIKKYGIREEVDTILGICWTKERIIKIAQQCRNQKEMITKIKYSKTQLHTIINKFNIKDEVKQILRQNKNST